jgi:hypothetical protein
MKPVLLVAIALGALNSAAFAHSWSVVSYAHGKCETSTVTPEMVYRMIEEGAVHGLSADRISPNDVTKDASGVIHVRIRVQSDHGGAAWMDFFSSARGCDQFVKDNNIKADQADSSDIN